MKTIPDHCRHYRSTPEFNQSNIPAGLLRAHTTAAGVWGRITVLEGRLLYRITDPRAVYEEIWLTPDLAGIVEPGIQHEVSVLGPVRFRVDFHRAAS